MKDGAVNIYVKVKDTDEKLYSKEFTAKDNGEINIAIDNLKKNKNLILEIEGENAKELELNLNSKQKLVQDRETPSKPKVQ